MNVSEAWSYILALAKQPASTHDDILLSPLAPRLWESKLAFSQEVKQLLDLYLPLCVEPSLVVAHLGQSLDGRIATHNGVSQFITGEENLLHTHRMRALFDAVIVGAHTAQHDNPRLTTRRAQGPHPTRVLIDPRCRIPSQSHLFSDNQAPTFVLCVPEHCPKSSHATQLRYIPVFHTKGVFAANDILTALKEEGLQRIFLEGGGFTISQFLHAQCLDRLHICVAPMILGSGRPSITLPEISCLTESHTFDVQHFQSGKDVLFDCKLR